MKNKSINDIMVKIGAAISNKSTEREAENVRVGILLNYFLYAN